MSNISRHTSRSEWVSIRPVPVNLGTVTACATEHHCRADPLHRCCPCSRLTMNSATPPMHGAPESATEVVAAAAGPSHLLQNYLQQLDLLLFIKGGIDGGATAGI